MHNYSPEEIQYIAGFDHGADFVIAELQRMLESHPELTLKDALARLTPEKINPPH